MAKTKSTPTTDIAKTGNTALSMSQSQLPAFMRGKAGQGLVNITQADVEIPRLVLTQALSKHVESHDIKPGDFFHLVAEQSLGNALRVTILYADINYILWKPREDGGGILARTLDGTHWVPANTEFEVNIPVTKTKTKKVTWKTANTVPQSGLADWGSFDPEDSASQPAATKMYNCVVYVHDHPEMSPCVVTLQRSSIKIARKLMAKLKIAQAPVYGLVFQMTSNKENGTGGEFYNYQFTADGLVEDEQMFTAFEEMFKRFEKEGVRVKDLESVQADATPEGGKQDVGDGKKF